MLSVLLYVFAVYGLCCLAYFNLRDRFGAVSWQVAGNLQQNEVFLVLKVQDAEEKIEGLVRECVRLSRKLGRPHRLVVFDAGSADQTGEILQRLAVRYPYLALDYVQDEGRVPRVVVEFDPAWHPRQAAEMLSKALRQEFST